MNKNYPPIEFDLPEFSDEHIHKLKEKDFKQSVAYKKYINPLIEEEKAKKRASRISWWKNNWISIITLVVSVLSLIATVIFGLR